MLFKLFTLSLLLITFTHADNIKKGKKIYDIMCDKKGISKILYDNKDELEWQIKDKNYCSNIDDKKLKSVVLYLTNQDKLKQKESIQVPKNSKCPVCGMLVAKYPKWVATIKESDGKLYYFDGVKDMMKYYFNHKEGITKMLVTDYYSQKVIDATKSYFVIGSDIYGPMGDELIPFLSEEDAKTFYLDHRGARVIEFEDIQEREVYKLDE